MKSALITFGCSWTAGVGSGYTEGMTIENFNKLRWNDSINDRQSFRGLLSKKYNLVNINWAAGGSSNQRQFRLAKLFFSSDEFKELRQNFDRILVLWGITSTARNEMFSIEHNDLVNFFYSESSNLAKSLVRYSYNHKNEVDQLSIEILHWNTFFKSLNINNLWFDTFNHHDYFRPDLKNLMFNDEKPRDILSKLAIHNGFVDLDGSYHESTGSIDTNRLKNLVECKVLNPLSYHPTPQGHRQIADMLSEYLEASL